MPPRARTRTRSAHVSLLAAIAMQSLAMASSSRRGVFFSEAEFPGTPGTFANQRSTPTQLKARIDSWTTQYQPTGPLTAEQHRQFFEDGYVVVRDIVPRDALDAAVSSVEGLVDNMAKRLFSAGHISDIHEGAGFQERLVLLEQEFPNANVLLHKNGVLPLGIQQVWESHALMSVAEQLLGAEAGIAGHPVWNLRCKTPEKLSQGQATVPWHQDNACTPLPA